MQSSLIKYHDSWFSLDAPYHIKEVPFYSSMLSQVTKQVDSICKGCDGQLLMSERGTEVQTLQRTSLAYGMASLEMTLISYRGNIFGRISIIHH